MNAARLSADQLQALMRHMSYQTTQRYINMAKQLDSAVDVLFVPQVAAKVSDRCHDARPAAAVSS